MLQPEVTIFHLGGGLIPAEELRDTLSSLYTFLEEGLELYSILLHRFSFFSNCSFFVSAFSPFPD